MWFGVLTAIFVVGSWVGASVFLPVAVVWYGAMILVGLASLLALLVAVGALVFGIDDDVAGAAYTYDRWRR